MKDRGVQKSKIETKIIEYIPSKYNQLHEPFLPRDNTRYTFKLWVDILDGELKVSNFENKQGGEFQERIRT